MSNPVKKDYYLAYVGTGWRGGGEVPPPPWGGALPHSNFELPWSGNFLIFMTFPPSPPSSLEKFFFPVIIPPLQKIFASLPYSSSLENFSSLSCSPLCKIFLLPALSPPSLKMFSFPVLIPPLKPYISDFINIWKNFWPILTRFCLFEISPNSLPPPDYASHFVWIFFVSEQRTKNGNCFQITNKQTNNL